MQEVATALSEVKDLYQKALGYPAPEVEPTIAMPFPPGVDPVGFVIEEVRQVKRLAEEMAHAPAPIMWVPRADMFASEEGFVIQVEIPGVAREDVKVFSSGGELVVRGERKSKKTTPETKPIALEMPLGTFERRFPLPPGTQLDQTVARYAQGLLELKVAGTTMGPPIEKPVEII